MRRRTWFAIVICVIGVVPGLFVGAFAAYAYRSLIGYGPDDHLDMPTLRATFGAATPGLILQWIYSEAIPALLHGGLSGAFAVLATRWIYRGARCDLAAYVTGALYSGLVLILLVWVVGMLGLTKDAVGSVVQIAGLWIGLLVALPSRRGPSPLPRPRLTHKNMIA